MSQDWIPSAGMQPSEASAAIAAGPYGPRLPESRRLLALHVDRLVAEEIVKYSAHVRSTILAMDGCFVEWQEGGEQHDVHIPTAVIVALLQCFPPLELT